MFAPAPLGRRFQRCPTPLDSSKETLGALGVPRAPRWPRASELPPRPAPPPQDKKPRGTRESRDLPPAPAGPGTTFRPVGHKRPSCGPPGHSLKRRKRSAQSSGGRDSEVTAGAPAARAGMGQRAPRPQGPARPCTELPGCVSHWGLEYLLHPARQPTSVTAPRPHVVVGTFVWSGPVAN